MRNLKVVITYGGTLYLPSLHEHASHKLSCEGKIERGASPLATSYMGLSYCMLRLQFDSMVCVWDIFVAFNSGMCLTLARVEVLLWAPAFSRRCSSPGGVVGGGGQLHNVRVTWHQPKHCSSNCSTTWLALSARNNLALHRNTQTRHSKSRSI